MSPAERVELSGLRRLLSGASPFAVCVAVRCVRCGIRAAPAFRPPSGACWCGPCRRELRAAAARFSVEVR